MKRYLTITIVFIGLTLITATSMLAQTYDLSYQKEGDPTDMFRVEVFTDTELMKARWGTLDNDPSITELTIHSIKKVEVIPSEVITLVPAPDTPTPWEVTWKEVLNENQAWSWSCSFSNILDAEAKHRQVVEQGNTIVDSPQPYERLKLLAQVETKYKFVTPIQ